MGVIGNINFSEFDWEKSYADQEKLVQEQVGKMVEEIILQVKEGQTRTQIIETVNEYLPKLQLPIRWATTSDFALDIPFVCGT